MQEFKRLARPENLLTKPGSLNVYLQIYYRKFTRILIEW